ncbi:ComEA family DNA-binding protein [Nocardioides malaquae]|nr:ComEA family DNA-binding protein [Nocardioides malaquae]
MRTRRPSPEHEQAVARRLAALSAEWDAARAGEESSWTDHTHVRGWEPVPDETEPPTAEPDSAQPSSAAPATAAGDPAAGDRAEPDGAAPAGSVSTAPVPGRHAARRSSAALRPQDALLDRGGPLAEALHAVHLRGVHLVWVALFASVVLAASAWWVLQSREVEMVPVAASRQESSGELPVPGAPVGAPSGSPAGSPVGASPSPVGEVVVDVTGKVRRPGIVVLPVGSRVVDAIDAAGGARRGVSLSSLNLARLLQDGEQIVVGAAAGAGTVPGSGGAPPSGASSGALVNLNSADVAELETLPGVGPVTAAAIVEWRTRHGGFTSVEDLLEVHGIGEVTLERLAALVTV